MALFKVAGREIEPLELHSFRDREIGGEGEKTLQDFISDFPDLIPGEEIDGDEPPVFAVVKAEAGVSSGSLDILLVDQKAVPTVVEAKLIDNREIRRAVVAQGIEYLAFLQTEWSAARLIEEGNDYWSKKGQSFDEVFESRLGIQFTEDYGRQLEGNIRAGRMRLIVAADELPNEAIRILEFLNETAAFDALGLELAYYVSATSGEKILAPRLIGQSFTATQRKRATAGEVWSRERFEETAQEKLGPEITRFALSLMDAGQRLTGEPSQWGIGKSVGACKIKGKIDGTVIHLFSVGTDGNVGVFMGWNGKHLSEELLLKYLQEGNQRFAVNWVEQSWRGFSSIPLSQLVPDGGEAFLKYVGEFLEEAKKELTSGGGPRQ